MAKYYVQSGNMRTIVLAESNRKAALWAVHQAMQQVLPMEEDLVGNSHQGKSEQVASDGVAVLSGKLYVSQRGFDRSDATPLPTMEVVNEWNELVMTLDRLERMLHVAR